MVQDILIKEYKIAISIFSPVWKCSEQTYVHLLPGAQALPSELTRFIACTHFSHLSLSLSLLGKIWNDKGLPIILWFVHRTHEHDFGNSLIRLLVPVPRGSIRIGAYNWIISASLANILLVLKA